MVHLNGNVLAAVDVETTGLKARFNDIIQVAVLPLGADLEPLPGVVPFYTNMLPKRPDNVDPKGMTTHKIDYRKLLREGLDAERVADLFHSWYADLDIPLGKSLIPLAHNWVFDFGFMEDWLGQDAMESYFFGHYRDTMVVAGFLNDHAEWKQERHPHPKLGLTSLCSVLGVENPNPHDALGDSVATARCYKEIIRRGLF